MPKQIKQILKEVLLQIKPDEKLAKETLKKVNEVLEKLNKRIKQNSLKAKAVLGGSFAKQTWVKGDYDVDIFVKFDFKYKNENLSELLEEVLKNTVHERVHGSRDYFLMKKDEINYEIIPVLDVKKAIEAENVTDHSPMHVNWVNKQGKNIKDDIMILKKFMKAQKIYGAENYIKGFSGHVVDILTIYYGGFLKLLKDAQKWKAKKIIDKNNAYKGKALMMMNKSKIEGPLVLVDPIMTERNAAAAVDENCFNLFIKSAGQFLKKPSKDFFEEEDIDLDKLTNKGKLIKVNVENLEGKEDVVGTKILKVYEYLKEKISEFKIIESGWIWDKKAKGMLWYLLKKDKLDPEIEIQGPPLKIKEHVQAFKKKHKKTFEKKGRIWCVEKRELIKPEDVIGKVVEEKYVVEKVKSVFIHK